MRPSSRHLAARRHRPRPAVSFSRVACCLTPLLTRDWCQVTRPWLFLQLAWTPRPRPGLLLFLSRVKLAPNSCWPFPVFSPPGPHAPKVLQFLLLPSLSAGAPSAWPGPLFGWTTSPHGRLPFSSADGVAARFSLCPGDGPTPAICFILFPSSWNVTCRSAHALQNCTHAPRQTSLHAMQPTWSAAPINSSTFPRQRRGDTQTSRDLFSTRHPSACDD